MSILEKYAKVFLEKDEAGINEVLHDDFKFTMHSSGNILSKSTGSKAKINGKILESAE